MRSVSLPNIVSCRHTPPKTKPAQIVSTPVISPITFSEPPSLWQPSGRRMIAGARADVSARPIASLAMRAAISLPPEPCGPNHTTIVFHPAKAGPSLKALLRKVVSMPSPQVAWLLAGRRSWNNKRLAHNRKKVPRNGLPSEQQSALSSNSTVPLTRRSVW